MYSPNHKAKELAEVLPVQAGCLRTSALLSSAAATTFAAAVSPVVPSSAVAEVLEATLHLAEVLRARAEQPQQQLPSASADTAAS